MSYWDGTHTKLWYVAGQLARLEDPGGEITDFAYASGRLTKVRDPLAADAVAAGVAPNDDTTRTLIAYDANKRVSSVTLAAPRSGALRPAHSYRYVSASETHIDVAGASQPHGYARKVTYDGAGRVLTDTDATARATATEWSPKDELLSSTDPAGRKTTTLYDATGLPTDSFGPAPASCFGADRRPNGSCTNPPVAHTQSFYDEGIRGLNAAYWANADLAGPPKVHATGVVPDGTLAKDWGWGGPPGLVDASGAAVVDWWSARFSGEILLPEVGKYQLFAWSDDGVRVYVDDILVSEYWSGHGFERSKDVAVINNTVAGSRHRIRVDYFEAHSPARLELHWTQPNGVSGIVPGDKLFPRYGLPTRTIAHDTTPGAPSEVNTTAYARPENGLATSTTTDPAGLNLTSTTTYEAPGAGYLRRTGRSLPAGNAWTYAYYGNTESRANPCASSVSANQAGMARTTTGPDPDGTGPEVARVKEAVYDAAGRVVASRVGSGAWACVTYDARGRPVSSSVPAWGAEPGRRIAYNYAVNGNPLLTSVADAVGTITTTVDLLGRVVSYTDVGGATTTSTYDQAGLLTDTSGPTGAQRYGYDPAGRPTTQTLDGATVATATYDAAGELAQVSYPAGTGNAGNATAGTIARDRDGGLASLAWKRADGTALATDAVTRSQAGKVVDQLIDGADAGPAAPNFTYDGAGRLRTAKVPGRVLSYDYAATPGCALAPQAAKNTNRSAMVDNGVSTSYCYDAADKLVSTTDARYGGIAYDVRGNTTALGPQALGYDGADRHVSTTTGTTTIRYVRDATDRIVRREVSGGSTGVVRYGYSGDGDTSDFTLDAN
ncbi:MAG: hypothetical protein KY439_12165, partial [Actinobacteria bacterium]|nr:hypothetical protein [Actinomycetota bacterium]